MAEPYDASQGLDLSWQPDSWYQDPSVQPAPMADPAQQAGPWEWRPPEWNLPDPTASAVPEAPATPGGFQTDPVGQPTPQPEEPLFPWQTPESLQAERPEPAPPPEAPGEEEPTYEFTPEETERTEVERQSRDPIANAQEAVRLEEDARQYKAQRQAEAAISDRQTAERNMAEWRKREAQIASDRQDLFARAEDFAQNGSKNFADSLSTTQRIGFALQAVAGGMLAPYNGGRNMGLEAIDKAIDQYMGRQEQLLNMQADELKARGVSSMELFKQLESQRIGLYQSTLNEIDAQTARLDPAGVRAQRLAQARVAVETQMKKEAIDAEQRLFERHKDEHDMRMKEQQERRLARDAASSRAQQRRALEAEMLVKGFIPDAKAPGGFSPDPNRAQAMDPQTYVQVQRGRRLEQENVAHERGIQVQDKNGRVLGLARYGTTDARKLGEAQGEYEAARQQSVRLHDLIGQYKSVYKGVGAARWPPEAKRRVETIIEDMAVRLAKIRDPESVAREGEVELARKALPDLDSWTSSKKPMAAYEELVKTIDQDYEARFGSRIIDWKKENSPAKRYQSIDRIIGQEVREAPREELIGEATIPLAGVTKQDSVLRSASISSRGRLIDALGDRGGITQEEAGAIRTAINTELAAGDLTKDEFRELDGRLTANQLVRSAPASFEERERAAFQAANKAGLPPQMAAEYVADQLKLAGGKRNAYIRELMGSGAPRSGWAGEAIGRVGGGAPDQEQPAPEESGFPDALYEEGD